MSKHSPAINILKDELEVIAKDVIWLMAVKGKLNLTKALFPDMPSVQVARELRYNRALKDRLAKGRSIMDSIKTLQEDN